MKIKLLGLLVIGLAIGLAAAYIYYHPELSQLVAPQPIITEDRDVSGYNQINFSGIGELQILQTGNEGITIQASADVISDIHTQVENHTLNINYRWDWQKNTLQNQRPIKIIVQAASLRQLNIAGAGNVSSPSLKSPHLSVIISGASQADLNLDTETLLVDLTGAGQITISGTTTKHDVNISGAGKYLARNLMSINTQVVISGLGTAEINSQKTLNIDISGGGQVSYLGNPKLNQHLSGLGSVTKLKP